MNIHFIVTSALNARHGVISYEKRLEHQAATYANIRQRYPEAFITTVENSPDPIDDIQYAWLKEHSDKVWDNSTDTEMHKMYEMWTHDAISKNLGESMGLSRYLAATKFLDDAIIIKLSGRYLLQDRFTLPFERGKVTVSGPNPTGNPDDFSDIKHWYAIRCVIWGGENQKFMADTYAKITQEILNHVTVGKYADIEHCMYKYLPKEMTNSVYHGHLGIEGVLAPNGEIQID